MPLPLPLLRLSRPPALLITTLLAVSVLSAAHATDGHSLFGL